MKIDSTKEWDDLSKDIERDLGESGENENEYLKTNFSDFTAMDAYFADISNAPDLLTKEEEIRLFRIIEKGKNAQEKLPSCHQKKKQLEYEDDIKNAKAARERIISSNLRLVINIASQKTSAIEGPLEDRIQSGNIGLMKAIGKFDVNMGFRFSTYATWYIRQEIQRESSGRLGNVRVPTHMADFSICVKKAIKSFFMENECSPSIRELADILDAPERKVELAMLYLQGETSLDSSMLSEDAESGSLYNIIQDESVESIEETYEKKEAAKIVREIVFNGTLNEREQQVVCMRFGIGRNKPCTLLEVGETIGVTRERVRQIERRALRKITQQVKKRLQVK